MYQSYTYRIWFRFCDAILAILLSTLVTCLAFGQTLNDRPIQELLPNQTIEGKMAGAESHRYRFDLKADEFFQARVEQKGIDVLLKLLDASDKVLATMDSPNGKQGQETLSFVAEKSGSFIIEVSSLNAKAAKGNYTIRREASRTATANDKRRVEVERVFVEGMTASRTAGQSDKAIAKLEDALAGWRELAESSLAELAMQQVKQVKVNKYAAIYFSGLYQERKKVIEALGEGQKLMAKSKADSLVAREKLNEALAMSRTLNPKLKDKSLVEKVSHYGEVSQQLLNILKDLEFDSKIGEALSLNGIAQTHSNLGEWQENVDYLKLALAVYQEILADKTLANLSFGLVGLKSLEAGVLTEISQTLNIRLGQLEEALNYASQALECYRTLYQETQDPKFKLREALTLNGIGHIYGRESKENAKAIEFFLSTGQK